MLQGVFGCGMHSKARSRHGIADWFRMHLWDHNRRADEGVTS